ncbi:MAG: hypothetical protein ABH867_03150 [Patescibacteria group bacterium]
MKKALILMSRGLDSNLAIYLIKKQRVKSRLFKKKVKILFREHRF